MIIRNTKVVYTVIYGLPLGDFQMHKTQAYKTHKMHAYKVRIELRLKIFHLGWLCGSKDYPYLPQGRDFSLDPPPPSTSLEIPVKLHTFTYIFGPLRTPQPPGISNPFHGGSMDIFWNYTFSIFLCLLALVVHELGLGDKGNQPRLKKIWVQFWPVKSTLYCTR